MHTPPPLPGHIDDTADRTAFPFQAAKASRLMPVLLLIVGGVFNSLKKSHPDYEAWMSLGFGAVVICISLLATGLAMTALCSIPRYGTRGLLVPACLGLCVPLLLATIAVPNFVKAREAALQNRAERNSIKEASHELKREARDIYQSDDPIGEGIKSLDKFQAKLDTAGSRMTGTQQAVTKAAAGFLSRMKTEMQRYEVTSRPIASGELLDASSIKTRAELKKRQTQITSFLAGNAALKKFISDYKDVYRQELAKAGLSGSKQESVLKGVARSSDAQYAILLKIRDTDTEVGQAAQQMLSILERNWGSWEYSRSQDRVMFQSNTAIQEWNAVTTRLDAAAQEQTRLQQELLNRI